MYTYLKADPVSVVLMSIPPLVPLSPTVVHVHFTSTQKQRNSLHERREESQRERVNTRTRRGKVRGGQTVEGGRVLDHIVSVMQHTKMYIDMYCMFIP